MTALQRGLEDASPGTAARPGSEVISEADRARALEILLEGIGMVMAGDGIGGCRILEAIASPSQPNLSFRWVALHWSARAAMRMGRHPAARAHVQEALKLAEILDLEARAVSQWTAAEMLAQGDPGRALVWLREARARFNRLGDAWGLARTWLLEARILVSTQREPEALEAARKASALDPECDEPLLFLARRALMRSDLSEAEHIVRSVQSTSADRVRTLIEALRQGALSQADACDLLRECDAPPSADAVLVLERIARSAPGLVQAQDALAWMLLKLGSYADSGAIFHSLLVRELAPGDRASAILGLQCVTHAQRAVGMPTAQLQAGGHVAQAPTVDALDALQSGAPPGGAAGPSSAFSGRLSGVFALPDVLELLRSARRTGLLVCNSRRGVGLLRLRAGRITGAAAPGTPPLAQLLASARKLSPRALEAVATQQAAGASDLAIGELLVRDGHIDAETAQEAMRQQVALAMRQLVHWTEGEFAFNHERDVARASPISVELDPQAILLEVVKEMEMDGASPDFSVEVKP